MKKQRKFGKVLFIALFVASATLNLFLLKDRNSDAGEMNKKHVTNASESDTEIVSEIEEEFASTQQSDFNIYNSGFEPPFEIWIEERGEAIGIPLPKYIEDNNVNAALVDSFQYAISEMPSSMFAFDEYHYSVPYYSDTVFSSILTFTYHGDEFKPDTIIHTMVCITYDLRTGEFLCLDDIVDMEPFAERISKEGFLYYPDGMGKLKGPLQQTLDTQNDYIVRALSNCCTPKVSTYMRPTFYLTEDSIWFYDLLPGRAFPVHTELYVKLDDIKDILKVDIGNWQSVASYQ